ncbi:hypothetical protein [Vibrio nereis]|uniref:Lipoprotein n=1 Tax=Vibrio nereis TaxID=693 RepID=A0A0M0HPX8_VIBNE|nr:hypothetical protein [Vibrio nereis]KOO04195.1 hypothetical protein AKJ17_04585 [Vibrio nereis]
MKKVGLFIVSALTLSGCQMMGGDTDIANTDFTAMSCEDIQQVFTDYQDNMNNIETGAGLLSVVGLGAGTDGAKTLMQQTYQSAATAARPVIKAKNCNFSV